MSEHVSILLVSPADSDGDPAVQESLRSIAAQSYPSSQRTLVHIHYVTDEPVARTSALSAARESASGDYVIHAHPGVVWDGNKLERQVEHLRNNPADAACAHAVTVRDTGGRTRSLDLSAVRAYGLRIAALLEPAWSPGVLLVRTEIDRTLGVFRNIEEASWEYDLRLALKGHRVGLIDEDLAVWNHGEASQNTRPSGLLAEGPRHPFLADALGKIRTRDLIVGKPVEWAAQLVLAGLHIRNGGLEAALAIGRELEIISDRPEVCYWRGVIHRLEAEYDAARKWFGMAEGVGAASRIHERVVAFLQQALQMPDYGQSRETALWWLHRLRDRGGWDPGEFVDLCEACTSGGQAQNRRLLEEAQALEWEVLFAETYGLARGA
jgi:hypothetical protein